MRVDPSGSNGAVALAPTVGRFRSYVAPGGIHSTLIGMSVRPGQRLRAMRGHAAGCAGGRPSVDDLAAIAGEQHRQPLPPHLQLFRRQPSPLGGLAKNP